jgi:hypothetical protein
MNIVNAWLYLIGTPQRARRLIAGLDSLTGRLHKKCGGLIAKGRCAKCKAKDLFNQKNWTLASPPPCPTSVLFSRDRQGRIYGDGELRPALDAWDQGFVTKADIRRYCQHIISGGYDGLVY